jgi:tetratricopeptide (TPR) repeat protein
VRQLIASRLERLSERGRLLATVAAVIGREFEFALLRQAAGLGDAEAAEGVEELVRRRVLHGVGERFDFTHDRIREVAHAEVLAPRRRVLHRSVAEAIAAVHAGGLDPHVLALGLHHQGAEMWPEAMHYLRRAAGQAFTQAAYREAATCLERALASAAHLPPTPAILDQMLDLQLQLRNALWPLAEFDRIERCLQDAQALAASLRDERGLGKIAAFMSVLRWITGDPAAARALARRARDAAAALSDRQLRVMANYYLGLAHHLLGEYREAEAAYLENVRTLTPDEPDPLGVPGSTLVRSACWAVLPLAERGDFSAGLDHGRTALALAGTARNPYDVVSASYCLAYLHCLTGALDLAIPLLERALALCRDRDIDNWLPQVTGFLGHAYSGTGRLDEGLALLEQAIHVYDATHAWPFRALLTVHRGAACVLAGRLDAAEALGQEALALARQHGERGHEAWALRLLGRVAAQRDCTDVDQADRHYGEARALAEQLGMRPLRALCHRELAALHERAGDEPRAREHRLAAAAMYRDLGMELGKS